MAADISAKLVKELRMLSGAGIMDCKNALKECDCDIEKSAEYLRIKGIAKAESKSGRDVAEGLVGSYIHSNGKIGVLIEVNCETDFVARNEQFQSFVADLALHIAGSDPVPLFISQDEVDKDIIEKEKKIYVAQAKETGKPDKIIDKIVSGKIDKYVKAICLLNQKFIKNTDMTVEEYVKEKIAKLGENISIKRFERFQIGE